MATLDQNRLLELLEYRWDFHSARAVHHEMLSQLGLEGRSQLSPGDVEQIASWLERSNRRADVVIAALRTMAAPSPVAAPKVAAPAPAPKPAAAPAPAPAPAPAAAPAFFDVKVGGPADVTAPHGALVRIVSDRAGVVRWGVSGWKKAPAELVPAGSAPGEGDTTDTKLESAHGAFELRFPAVPAAVTEIDFVVRFEDNSWTKDARVRFA